MDTNISKIMDYVSIGVCIVVLILIGVLCRQIFLEKGNAKESKNESIDDMITAYLDKEELKYSTRTLSDSAKVYYLSWEEGPFMRVIADQKRQLYRIEGNLDLKNSIKPEDKTVVIEQINKYNSEANVASSYLDENNDIIFWLTHSCEDGAYSEECFEQDFYLTLKIVDRETPKLLNDAGITPPPIKD